MGLNISLPTQNPYHYFFFFIMNFTMPSPPVAVNTATPFQKARYDSELFDKRRRDGFNEIIRKKVRRQEARDKSSRLDTARTLMSLAGVQATNDAVSNDGGRNSDRLGNDGGNEMEEDSEEGGEEDDEDEEQDDEEYDEEDEDDCGDGI